MLSLEYILLVSSTLILLSILAIRLSAKLGIPSFLLFLAIGMLTGSDGPGGIHFDYPALVQSLGVIALTFILFSGGLDTEWKSIRPVLWQGLALSTLGVLVTAVLVGVFAAWILHFTVLEGLLLGAIVSSTDAAAVFMVLRARNLKLQKRVASVLEFESGSNDPMAVLLTLGIIRVLTAPSTSILDLTTLFVLQISIGGVVGYVMGEAMRKIVNAIKLDHEGLYSVLSLALVLFTYGLTSSLGGNGFLAIYLAALVMRKGDFTHRESLLRFHDGLAWLMQITMFLILGLQVFPSRLPPIIGVGLLISAFLILVARPAGVFASLLFTNAPLEEKTFISWVGLRGAVPIILATFPLVSGIPQADFLFHLVFFIVLTSVLLQGPLIPAVAKFLKLEL
jgi:cell volume regulation protein A